MSKAAEFRRIADKHRHAAGLTSLPLVRKLKLEAAERLELLANEVERFEVTSQIACRQRIFD